MIKWSAMKHVGVPVFDPPKTFGKGPFDFALNTVSLIASNPFLPLQFWVTKTPNSRLWRRHRPICALPLFQLSGHLGRLLCCWSCIRSTVTSQIFNSSIPIPYFSLSSITIVALHFRPPIPTWFGSVILHFAQFNFKIWSIDVVTCFRIQFLTTIWGLERMEIRNPCWSLDSPLIFAIRATNVFTLPFLPASPFLCGNAMKIWVCVAEISSGVG